MKSYLDEAMLNILRAFGLYLHIGLDVFSFCREAWGINKISLGMRSPVPEIVSEKSKTSDIERRR